MIPQTANPVTFQCSICDEPSERICVYCTKDTCENHICEKCLRCSDCCTCEVPLESKPNGHAASVLTVAEARLEMQAGQVMQAAAGAAVADEAAEQSGETAEVAELEEPGSTDEAASAQYDEVGASAADEPLSGSEQPETPAPVEDSTTAAGTDSSGEPSKPRTES
jgi:hypothetical protein